MSDTVPTVLGEVSADSLGRILPHEHIASCHGGWNKLAEEPNPEWEQVILEHYTPLLASLARDYDCRTLVDVTPKAGCYGPRDLEVWAELSRRSGVNIVISTGYFSGRYRPSWMHDMTVSQLADEMIRDLTEGVYGSRVKAGVIKVNIDDYDPDGVKLLRAAAIAQHKTGASITNCISAPRSQNDILLGAGVPPERIYMGHTDYTADPFTMLDYLRRGVRTIFTTWGHEQGRTPDSGRVLTPKYYAAELSAIVIAEGYANQLLISVDYSAMSGIEGGRLLEDLYGVPGRTFTYMFTHALDSLRLFGISEEMIEHIMRDNPRCMLLRA